jgi:hypothetical protein
MWNTSGGRELFLQVSGPVADSERTDAAAATALLRELQTGAGLRVSRAGLDSDGTESGRKGGEVLSLAELAITGAFSATTLAALTRIVISFVRRGAARRIILRDGTRTLTIVDPSERTERAVAYWLTGSEPSRAPDAPEVPDSIAVPESIEVPQDVAHARRDPGSGVD